MRYKCVTAAIEIASGEINYFGINAIIISIYSETDYGYIGPRADINHGPLGVLGGHPPNSSKYNPTGFFGIIIALLIY